MLEEKQILRQVKEDVWVAGGSSAYIVVNPVNFWEIEITHDEQISEIHNFDLLNNNDIFMIIMGNTDYDCLRIILKYTNEALNLRMSLDI